VVSAVLVFEHRCGAILDMHGMLSGEHNQEQFVLNIMSI